MPGLLVTTLLIGACASGSDPSASEPEIGPVPTVTTTADLTFPLDSYQLSTKEYATVRRAAWRLIRECVAGFGGEYTVPEQAMTADLPRFGHRHERRYSLYDAESAAARGYNLPPDQLPPSQAETKAHSWNPSDAEKLLVRGRTRDNPDAALPSDPSGRQLPADGCQGEADRKLAEGAAPPPNQNLPNELAFEEAKRAEADSRVRAAMKRWSECMQARGYTYETIWEPNNKEWPDPATDEEIATATADVTCKRETGLLGTWLAVESAYQRKVIEARAQELEAVQDHIRRTADRAARLVSEQ